MRKDYLLKHLKRDIAYYLKKLIYFLKEVLQCIDEAIECGFLSFQNNGEVIQYQMNQIFILLQLKIQIKENTQGKCKI